MSVKLSTLVLCLMPILAPVKSPKTSAFTGEADYMLWNEIQRDEYDNTAELLSLLQNGGLQGIARARNASDEDTFLLGPDVAGALERNAGSCVSIGWTFSSI